jgi:hypothetical protein
VAIELEYVQHMLLFDAADIANQQIPHEDLRLRNGQPARLHGEVFRADPVRSTKGGLCLSVDTVTANSLSKASIKRLHELGVQSMRKALVQNKEQFVGVLVGEARQGRNYFDRFVQAGQQGKLF